MKLFIGVDDSGRGPIIGPMLMAGVLVDELQRKHLKDIGCKDSKMLNYAKRKELAKKIKEIVLGYEIIATSPTEIDGRASVGLNLNKIEAVKTAEIINRLLNAVDEREKLKKEKKEHAEKNEKDKVIETEIYVDCPSPNIEAWQNYLAKHVANFENIQVILKCEHKADVNHVDCSAASILAKDTRDAEVEKIKKEIGFDIGSGYPSDPVTVEFLDKHSSKFKNHGIFRKTWSTWQEHEAKKEQRKLDGF
jgi:ribonuclease HII